MSSTEDVPSTPRSPMPPGVGLRARLESRVVSPAVTPASAVPRAGTTTIGAWRRNRLRRWVVAQDLTWSARLAAAEGPLLDHALPALGRSADHSRLWLGVSAGLAASGRRNPRRGAARGLIGIALASPTANLFAKYYTRRARPQADSVPLIRRLRRVPITTSFPSGHSASAAAFATGVLLEDPMTGIPVALAAGGVALSRVVTAAHFPSDVIAGCALGAAAGMVTLALWPRIRLRAAEAPVAAAPRSIEGEGVEIVINASSGGRSSDRSPDLAERLRSALPSAKIVEVEGDGVEGAVAAAAGRCEILGIAGGDGTVNTAARHAVLAGKPLLLIPAGTLNHFARELGLSDEDAALEALRAGQAVAVDVASVGDEVFLNTCSAGVYTDMVLARQRFEAGVGKWPAMVMGAVRVLVRGRPQDLVLNGSPRRLWLFFAGNNRYQPEGFVPSHRADLADGLIDVRIIDADRRFGRLRAVTAVLTGALGRSPVYDEAVVDGLHISAPEDRLVLSLDGEPKQCPPSAILRKTGSRLIVYRPAVTGTA